MGFIIPGLFFRLQYVPKQIGSYSLCQSADNGRTFSEVQTANVFDPSGVKVLKSGPTIAGQNNSLIIDTGSAGKGALSVALKGAGQDVPHSIRDLGHGKFEITYLPKLAVDHKLDVKYNNVMITNKLIDIQVRKGYLASKQSTYIRH